MRAVLILIALFAPAPIAAHPHVFVTADVRVVFDDNGALAVHLTWEYDELFSLLVTSDLGLDMDGDLLLTAAEQDVLETQIAAWPPDFAGDLEVMQGDTLLPLGDKRGHNMIYENGLFTETHLRPVAVPTDPAAPIRIRVYDPSFYTAYDLGRPVTVTGRDDCKVEIVPADLDAAYALAESLNANLSSGPFDGDYDFPAIGDAFADTIIVTCAQP
ncbi:MAG: DUF1007 family protein [Pseudomonadota bacterium]